MKLIFAALPPIFILIFLTLSNFCFSEMRWLSEEEKIQSAVQYVLRSGDFSPQYWDTSRVLIARDPRPITYANVAEFQRANPGCCEIVSRDPDGFKASVIDQLTGRAACMVRVKYSVQYIDKEGLISRGKPKVSYPVIKNCGLAWSGT